MSINSNSLVLISEALKAIAHPDRINILFLLKNSPKQGVSVSEISDKLNLTQPEVSRHLSILKNKGILVFKRAGVNIFYFINPSSLIYDCIESLLN